MNLSTSKSELFANAKPIKALMVMAIPTILSQLVVLIYNLADTFFIGSTNNPYMVAGSSLGLTIFMLAVALSNVFGVGGGALMARLIGEKKLDDAKKVVSFTLIVAFISSILFCLLVLAVMNPLLIAMGATDNTLEYAKQYVLFTTVIGGLPCIMSMCMAQLLRNTGYAREAGFGIILGSLLNIGLDPLFMFVILPQGQEVLGAGLATMISNVICFAYFIFFFIKLRNKTPLSIPYKWVKIDNKYKKSIFGVGLPAALAILLFDIVTILTNRISASYGDISLAAMGIVLKVERIPINIGLGLCLGMVPLIAFNYGSGNLKRVKDFLFLTSTIVLIFSIICSILFFFISEPIISIFIKNEETITQGSYFLKGRCFALPLIMLSYVLTNYMNAVGKGLVSLLFAIIRHAVIIIPIMILMNHILGLDGFTWSQLVSDALNIVVCIVIFILVNKKMMNKTPNVV